MRIIGIRSGVLWGVGLTFPKIPQILQICLERRCYACPKKSLDASLEMSTNLTNIFDVLDLDNLSRGCRADNILTILYDQHSVFHLLIFLTFLL